MSRTITLTSGIVVDLSPCGVKCEIETFDGKKQMRVIVGEYVTNKGKYFLVATQESLNAWDGIDPCAIPGIGFPERLVRVTSQENTCPAQQEK